MCALAVSFERTNCGAWPAENALTEMFRKCCGTPGSMAAGFGALPAVTYWHEACF